MAPVAQGSRGQKVPQTLPSSDPAQPQRSGGRLRTIARRGAASTLGCPPELLQHRTSLLGLASLAPFFRHPHPLGSSQPPKSFQGLGVRPRHSPLTCVAPRGRTRSPLRDEAAVGNLFFLSVSFLQ